MEIIEFEKPYFSSIDGVVGDVIEPNEAIWKRSITPAHLRALGITADFMSLEATEAHTAQEQARGFEELSLKEDRPGPERERATEEPAAWSNDPTVG